jgi:hypothetical protein
LESFKTYCLLNEVDVKRINLPKDPSKTELHKNEAQFFLSNDTLTLERHNPIIDNIRLNFFVNFTYQVVNHFSLKNLNFRFLVNFNDGPENDAIETRFCFARPRKSPHICIPDSHLGRTVSICDSLQSIDKPFEEKLNKASFFGSDTGRKYKDGSVQRVNLCNRYKNSDKVVAKITNFVEQPFDVSIYQEPVSIKDQLNYKYILNVNGNTTSWERLIWAMHSNSFCIFIKPPTHQDEISWYYHIFDLSQYFLTLDEDSLDNFLNWSDNWQAEIKFFKEHQKKIAKTLAKPDFHAHYYAQVLLNYNQIYNESIK